MTIQLQGQEIPRSINNIIEDVLGAEDLVSVWGLQSPFSSPYTRITATEISSTDQTQAPSERPTGVFSAPPTTAPSLTPSENRNRAPAISSTTTEEPIGPTTEEPSKLPSGMPSLPPTMAPTPRPTPSPTATAVTGAPSTVPTSPPTFSPMVGDELFSSHYVHFTHQNLASRAEAESACAVKGLELCSTSAITNFEFCCAGWLTDGAGWWMTNTPPNPQTCGNIGFLKP